MNLRKVAARPIFLAALLCTIFSSCSGKSSKTTPELSKMEGKKVALVEIQGEETSRNIVEVALINQLVRTGNFIIISKQDLAAAKLAPDVDPSNAKAVAARAGADFALTAKVLNFDADTRMGYDAIKVEDSQLAAETGDGNTEQIYKVRQLSGHVKVQLDFTDLTGKSSGKSGIAERTGQVTEEAKNSAAHLPPRLRFLEDLSNQAFHDFFETYQ
jgi:hypothetical protein